jgi:hypothetical protein
MIAAGCERLLLLSFLVLSPLFALGVLLALLPLPAALDHHERYEDQGENRQD